MSATTTASSALGHAQQLGALKGAALILLVFLVPGWLTGLALLRFVPALLALVLHLCGVPVDVVTSTTTTPAG